MDPGRADRPTAVIWPKSFEMRNSGTFRCIGEGRAEEGEYK